MLEWIIGAAIVGSIVYLARRSSSSDSAPSPALGPKTVSDSECDVLVSKFLEGVDPEQQEIINGMLAEGNPAKMEEFAMTVEDLNPKLAECFRRFKKGGDKFALFGSPSPECVLAVNKWIAALEPSSQEIVKTAIAEGDSTALEAFASVVDGANPDLAKCIRAMKPKIISSEPVKSTPTYTSSPITSKSAPVASSPITSSPKTMQSTAINSSGAFAGWGKDPP